MKEQFGLDAYEQADDIDRFWDVVASHNATAVAYVSRRNAREYAGMMELIRRRASHPLDLIDITDLEFQKPDGSPDLEKTLSIAELTPNQIIQSNLLDSSNRVSQSAALAYATHWQRLRAENASLRIIDDGMLVSVPVTYFDKRICSHMTPEWMSFGRTMATFYSTTRNEGIQAPDVRFIASRITALIEMEICEGVGDFSTFQNRQRSLLRLRK